MKVDRVVRNVQIDVLAEKTARRWLELYEPIVERAIRSLHPCARRQTAYDEDDLRQIGRMAVLEAVMGYEKDRPGAGGTPASIASRVNQLVRWRIQAAIQSSIATRPSCEMGGFSTVTHELSYSSSPGHVEFLGARCIGDFEAQDDDRDFATMAARIEETILGFEVRDRGILASWLQDMSYARIAEWNGISSHLVKVRVTMMLDAIRLAVDPARPATESPGAPETTRPIGAFATPSG